MSRTANDEAAWEALIAAHPERVISDSSRARKSPSKRRAPPQTPTCTREGEKSDSTLGIGALDGKIDAIRIDGRLKIEEKAIAEAIINRGQPPGLKFKSGLEGRFANYCRMRQACGEIDSWYYEPIELRLAPRTMYTPDFVTIKALEMTVYEVKGYMRAKASQTLKTARSMYFPILLVRWKKGEWVIT